MRSAHLNNIPHAQGPGILRSKIPGVISWYGPLGPYLILVIWLRTAQPNKNPLRDKDLLFCAAK